MGDVGDVFSSLSHGNRYSLLYLYACAGWNRRKRPPRHPEVPKHAVDLRKRRGTPRPPNVPLNVPRCWVTNRGTVMRNAAGPSRAAASRWTAAHKTVHETPRVYDGADRGVVGAAHAMLMAVPGPKVARAMGLNRNHHVRVWCTCMTRGTGTPWGDENDPRRLGSFDALGYADVRVAGDVVSIYQQHLKRVRERDEQDDT